MLAGLRRAILAGAMVMVASCAAWAQTTTLEGNVLGEDGKPLKGAWIYLIRTDVKGNYKVQSDKKGHWLYTGLPAGKFNVELKLEKDGETVDKVNGVQASYGDNQPINFDVSKLRAQQKAASQGQVSEEQAKSMSKEDKEKYEAAAKKNAEAMKKNKALNDAYNAAQDQMKLAAADTDKAKQATEYQAAIDDLNKAGEMDPNQTAVWNTMGEAYAALGKTQTGDDRNKSYESAIDAYKKSLAIKPDVAALYNQIGNLYGAEKKMPEATEALNKAAQLDPTMAAKAYFNMGANLVNSGQPDKAGDFFKKATDADPKYAEAWYQYGNIQMMQGKVDPKTGQQSYPPDTATALKTYLDLQPNGPHAAEATAMLQAMGETVQTKTVIPQKKKN